MVLALQVLGGDPETAYLTAISGAGYAVVLAVCARERSSLLFSWRTLIGAVFVWVAATLGVVYARLTPPRLIVTNGLVIVAWVGVGVVVAWRWHRRRVDAQYAPFLAGLVGSGILAVALAAVQVLPVLEFARQSRRVSGELRDQQLQFQPGPFPAC